MPIRLPVIIICPVDDTGRYSVKPSTIARIIASISDMQKIRFFKLPS
jgi:hypothetical protein